MRKSEPPSCRRLAGVVVIGKPLELDGQVGIFAHYARQYLEIEEAKYNTDQEEAINCPMQMQGDQ